VGFCETYSAWDGSCFFPDTMSSFFSQDFATQAFDAGDLTATQLGSQVDFSFLDFGTQDVPGFTEFDFAKASPTPPAHALPGAHWGPGRALTCAAGALRTGQDAEGLIAPRMPLASRCLSSKGPPRRRQQRPLMWLRWQAPWAS
jgi:hypothetical protein